MHLKRLSSSSIKDTEAKVIQSCISFQLSISCWFYLNLSISSNTIIAFHCYLLHILEKVTAINYPGKSDTGSWAWRSPFTFLFSGGVAVLLLAGPTAGAGGDCMCKCQENDCNQRLVIWEIWINMIGQPTTHSTPTPNVQCIPAPLIPLLHHNDSCFIINIYSCTTLHSM